MPFALSDLSAIAPMAIFWASVSVASGVVLWIVFVDRAFARSRRGQEHPLGWRKGNNKP